MAWTEFKPIPNEYNDAFKSIDEQILRLLTERMKLANGRRYYPPTEQLEAWTGILNMTVPQMHSVLLHLLPNSHCYFPEPPDELVNVAPLLKKTVVDGIEYHMTHAMHYRNGSEIAIEIRLLDDREHVDRMHPQIHLEVTGKEQYIARRDRVGGGGSHTHMTFFVTPSIAEPIEGVQFRLIPVAPLVDKPRVEVILDKEVRFE
ncbi:hypothetical protein [Paenibacillus sp. MMS18-CY102]|uniref:hypothetical protein n=1 Tax=Paenibacillus sp. MMS18-CY102 TaxID=2682849 RepID=UPI0013659728|nr:hypothetical protein [Paenibacillus sp. MMS18-CY102]MWC26897.1 hypothetical protein [Paenibacillus sp. MMS18-CY102]